MIAGVFFDGQNARLHQVQLGLQDGMITVTGKAILRAYPYADARIEDMVDYAPCVLDFIDGARCEIDDAESKSLLAHELGATMMAAQHAREQWIDVLIVVGLLAAGILALLWQH